MNFLLYMLGRGVKRGLSNGEAGGLRPSVRDVLLQSASAYGANGRLDMSLTAYRKLTDGPETSEISGNSLDALVRGHLHLALKEYPRAREFFAWGMTAIIEPGGIWQSATENQTQDSGAATSVEVLLNAAEHKTREGRFVRAIELLQKARALIDVLLSAEAGQLVAAAAAGHEKSSHGLDALVRLSDSTLRMLARVHLARGVASGLREKRLRDDLAGWATTGRNVSGLLEAEYRRHAELSTKWKDHAELAYRLGLLARATGRMKDAAAAFERVLQAHPHHVASAAMLAVSRPRMDPGVLRTAMNVHPETMKTFGAFAQCAALDDGRRLEQFVGRMMHRAGAGAGSLTRANLAFALAEVGLLDEQRAAWRETVPA